MNAYLMSPACPDIYVKQRKFNKAAANAPNCDCPPAISRYCHPRPVSPVACNGTVNFAGIFP
ncbi:hypothetical protein OFC08_29965, partial [Escherichia coli]|nr:hypothetical protein [Escherichia coli]